MSASLESKLAAPGYECVHFAEDAPRHVKGAELRRLDGAAVVSKDSLMASLSAVLSFPDYFGGNWDAAEECLRELEWLDAKSLVLVVTGAGELWREAPGLASGLQSVWLGAAGAWAGRDIGFHLVWVW